MATEFNPNDFRRQTFGNGTPQPQSMPGHAPVPAPQQAPVQAQPYAPPAQPIAQPHAQPQAQPYTPPLTAPALGTPHTPAMPQPTHAQPYPSPYPQQQQQQIPQPHMPQQQIPQAPGIQAAPPYTQAPQPAQNMAPQGKAGKLKRLKMPKGGVASSGFLKPFLMGLLCGSVMTIVGVSVLGSMAKKSMDNRFASVAAQVQNNPELTPETIVIVDPEDELSPGQ